MIRGLGKFFNLATKRPFAFFAMACVLIAGLSVLTTMILGLIMDAIVVSEGLVEYLVVMMFFLPTAIIFFASCFIFSEWLLVLFGLGKVFGLEDRPILRWVLLKLKIS
ncbi:MAG: hypothetical protein AAF583_14775 [Pseudomonadota bacterium]